LRTTKAVEFGIRRGPARSDPGRLGRRRRQARLDGTRCDGCSPIAGNGQPESPPFDLDNRGKRSVALDLGTDEGRQAAHRLIEGADVFLTNLRPEAVERLGLGPSALMAINPRLVYASVTGYGLDGPDANRAGYDVGGFWPEPA
jgi:crotonobetainyl-CoA:carnitine CoA-transferase CaiB-like acyl-CoA transferase